MREEIKQRIEAVRRGEVPEEYRRIKDIGIAPSGWGVGKLSDVLQNVQRPVSKPDSPYWRLGIRSWAKGTFRTYVEDPSTVDMDELYVVRENDLVLNITFAWEHAIAVASKEDDGLLVSHRFPTYVFDGGNVPAYYKEVVSQRFFKDMLDHISPGGAGRNRVLNRKDFLELPCHIPPVAEQEKIAEILSTCDHVIELKQQLLEEKRKQKQWIMHLIFDEQYLISESAVELSFDEVFVTHSTRSHKIKTDQYESSGKYPVIDQGKRAIVAYSNDETKVINCPKTGLIVFGDHTKEIKFVDFGFIVGADGVQLISAQENVLSTEFGYYLLASKKLPNDGYSRHFKYLKEEAYTVPDKNNQDRITLMLKTIDNEKELLEQELEAWQQKKKALMQLLLTGLVRVNA